VLVEDKLGVTMTEIIRGTRLIHDTAHDGREQTNRRLHAALIVGHRKAAYDGHKIAWKCASVTHAEDHESGDARVARRQGADLLLVDVALDIRDLVMRPWRGTHPRAIVACGISMDARARSPPSTPAPRNTSRCRPIRNWIAAVLAAVANDSRDLVYRDEAMAR